MKLLAHIPTSLTETCQRLVQAGHRVHLVGGAVRDFLLGRATSDYDLASSATPEQVTQLFEHVIPTGWRHGTVTIRQPDGLAVEVTTYRQDGAYSDGRHPDRVQLCGSIEQDLERRDFTINAMAVEFPGGTLIDPHGGVADLRARVVRAVGEPGRRFAEDSLRMLRALRLATVLEFDIEPATLAAITRSAREIKKVAAERQRDELVKLLAARQPSAGLRRMLETGLLGQIVPELAACAGVEQGGRHQHDVFEHSLRAVDEAPADDLTLRLALLLHDIGKPATARGEGAQRSFHGHEQLGADLARQVLGRLRLPAAQVNQVEALTRLHMWHYTPDWSDGAVRRFVLRTADQAPLDQAFRFREADLRARGEAGLAAGLAASRALQERIAGLQEQRKIPGVKDLALDGREVAAVLGVRPGPVIGQALTWLHEQVLDHPELNDRERLRALLASWPGRP